MKDVDEVVAFALRIPRSRVDRGLRFGSVAEWDSLGHMSLIVALEQLIGRSIPDEQVAQLTDVETIRRFVQQRTDGRAAADSVEERPDEPTVHVGLKGMYVDESAITRLDAAGDAFEYRGFDVSALAQGAGYERTAYLLVESILPEDDQLADFARAATRSRSDLRPYGGWSRGAISPVDAMLIAITEAPVLGRVSASDADWQIAAEVVSVLAEALGQHYVGTGGQQADVKYPSVAARLLALFGVADKELVSVLDALLVLQADHEMNASTFAARIAVGAGASVSGALAAALATFSGARHGGATGVVGDLLTDVGSPSRAQEVLEDYLSSRRSVPGFGHRVYVSRDPRVASLRQLAQRLAQSGVDDMPLQVADALTEAAKPYARHGVFPNVDLYSAAVYFMLGVPRRYHTALFACARSAGWIAHIREQGVRNTLIRPSLSYIGPRSRPIPAFKLDRSESR